MKIFFKKWDCPHLSVDRIKSVDTVTICFYIKNQSVHTVHPFLSNFTNISLFMFWAHVLIYNTIFFYIYIKGMDSMDSEDNPLSMGVSSGHTLSTLTIPWRYCR